MAGLPEVRHRLGPELAPQAVMGQALHVLDLARGSSRSSSSAIRAWRRAAVLGRQTLVGDLLGEHVREDMRGVSLPPASSYRNSAARSRRRPARSSSSPRSLTALRRKAGIVRPMTAAAWRSCRSAQGQAVDARHEHGLHRLRHGLRGRAAALFADLARQLLQEERVALGPLEDQLHHRVLDGVLAEQRADDPGAVVGREGLQRDLGGVRSPHPRRLIAGAVGGHQEDRRAGHAVGQRGQQLLRRAVDPVQILDGDDERLAAAQPEQEPTDDLEGSRLGHLGAEGAPPCPRPRRGRGSARGRGWPRPPGDPARSGRRGSDVRPRRADRSR